MAKNAVRAHLGKGWTFPVRPDSSGRLNYVGYEEDVEQAIGIILQTAHNERVLLPRFGANLPHYLFAGNSPVTHRQVEEDVRKALVAWEPRITVERVQAYADEQETNLLLIEIDYVVRRSNSFYNRVFPFYLNEAG